MGLIRSVTMGLTACLLITPATAQVTRPAPVSQLAVDVVGLKSGKLVRGAIVDAAETGSVTMLVAREWLKGAVPDLYQATAAKEPLARMQVLAQLRDRLAAAQRAAPPNAPRLVFFLDQEHKRVTAEQERPEPAETPFVWLELDRDSIRRITRAPLDRQRVAMWAWSERLPGVETRDLMDLQRELRQRKVDTTAPPPDLADRLPPRMQGDREWAARMAIVEYTLAKPLDFQGTGELLVRVDGQRTLADLAPVLSKVLQSQVDSLLKELAGEVRPPAAADIESGLKSASREADAASIRGLRATRVEVKVDQNQAAVQTSFAARMPDGTWEAVWSHRETLDATRPRPDSEARIVDDPQVKQILDAATTFGLGADDQVRRAIRFGAATMAAQQAADARFFEFRDRYLKRLDGPPLAWTRAQQ